MSNYYETRLSCDHIVVWSQRAHVPKLRERVYCQRCMDMRTVIGVPESWHAQCQDCNFDVIRSTLTVIHRHIYRHIEERPEHTVLLNSYDLQESYLIAAPSVNASRPNELSLFDSTEE